MEEQWKNLKPPFDDYSISNFGRIRNKKGQEIKPTAHCCGKDKKYAYPTIHLCIRRNKQNIYKYTSLAGEVYKAFGKGKIPDRVIVSHIDGDKWNCRIDNLHISKGYTTPPTEEQVKIYEEQVIPCVRHIVGRRRFFDYANLIDVENIMGESFLKIWIHLSQYPLDKSFYGFCKRYVEFAFKEEWAKRMKEREYITYYGDDYDL